MPLVISLRPRTVALVLALIAGYLAVQSLAARYIVEATASPPNLLTNLIQVLNVNRESSLPAWYSSGLLLLAAALLAVNAALHRQERYARHWAGLAAIFLYLSADEAAAIHEEFTDPLQTALNTSGYLSFAWVIAGAAFVLVVGVLYARFVLHLPPATRRGMIAAAVLYVGGALVIESISANQWELDGGSSLLYSAIGTLEELCEMLGVIVLIYTLLAYLEQRQVTVHLDFTGAARGVPPPPSRRRSVLPLVIAFGSGVSFSIAQWVLARESGAFLGAELAGQVVIAAAVIGLLSGHFLAGRLQRRALLPVMLALHLTLPVWLRLLAAGLDTAGLPAVSLLAALVTALFYSGLLAAGGAARPSAAQYGALLAGAVAGCQSVVLLAGVGITALLLVYSAVLLGLLLALRRRVEAGLLALAAGAWLMAFPAVNDWSNARWYRQVAGLPAGTITRYSAYSLYQKVDVLETPDGRRVLYLDGLNVFDTADNQPLNRALAGLPGQLTRSQAALVIGASSISLEAALAQAAGQVTLDERDALALDARARFFPTWLTRTPAAEQAYLAAAPARYDLIVSTVPPVDYSEAFMAQAIKTRLTPGGVWVIRLAGAVEPDNHIARRVTAGLLLHFDDVVILTSPAGWSVIYAGDPLPFGRRELEAALREPSFTILDTAAVRAFTGGAQPVPSGVFDRLLLQLDWLSARWSNP